MAGKPAAIGVLSNGHGYADYGGGPIGQPMAHGGHAHGVMGGRSVTSLTADPTRPADVAVTLTARKERFLLPSGKVVNGYTLNGQSPGPIIRVTAGQLVQVRLINESIPDGITLHWHGVDVPNAEDGVAGVTQDAVPMGKEFIYRFGATQVGTFWYHSHQLSHEQVRGGLLGPLVVMPKGEATQPVDVTALVHLYGGVRTVNGQTGDEHVTVPPGERARVRVINTDNGPMSVWVGGAAYRLVAIDGTDVNEPARVDDAAVLLTAGGRADVEVAMPENGSPVRVPLGGSVAVVLGSTSFDARRVSRPVAMLDPLSYGVKASLPFDPEGADRRFEYTIGRRPGFLDGRPEMLWTINGHAFPDVPMFVVADGNLVRMRVTNRSGEVHPMHLHGHHAVVLSRNGVPATGSPWWTDSLNVANGESYEIAFAADNPGIWMDHCHNLPHAQEGLVAHVMYEGVTTPFMVGGTAANKPE